MDYLDALAQWNDANPDIELGPHSSIATHFFNWGITIALDHMREGSSRVSDEIVTSENLTRRYLEKKISRGVDA